MIHSLNGFLIQIVQAIIWNCEVTRVSEYIFLEKTNHSRQMCKEENNIIYMRRKNEASEKS